jgi:hypothetical protein
MELPSDVNQIIKEFSLPITRPDWKLGSYMMREYKDTYYGPFFSRLNKRDFKIYLLHCLVDSHNDYKAWALNMEMKDFLFSERDIGSVNEMLGRIQREII